MNNNSSMDCVNRQDVVRILILPSTCAYRSMRETKAYLKEKELLERQHRIAELRRARAA